jgi:ribosomal protein L14E/L6E/L27E
MTFIHEGSVCVLTKGRRMGNEVTIAKVVGDKFVVVKDEKGRERKCSVKHLVPAAHKKAK